MSSLETRIAKIEAREGGEMPIRLVIIRRIVSPGEDGPYNVIRASDKHWRRRDGEEEEAFIERAKKQCSGRLIKLTLHSSDDAPA